MKILLLFMLFNKVQLPNDTAKHNPDHFIAMEYKGLSNCIYKVFITDSLIMCAKVNGYITVQPNFGIGTSIPRSVMHDPEAYVNKKMEARYTDILSDNQKFIKANKGNFIIRKSDIKGIVRNPQKKWGMGYYPNNGTITIQTIETEYNDSIEREFVLVGDQSAEEVLAKLKREQ